MDQLDLDRPAPDQRKGMEVAEGDVATDGQQDSEEAQTLPLTLTQRMAEIRKACAGVGKEEIKMSYTDKKSNERREYSIQGHTIEGILHGVRSLLDAFGVWVSPNLVNVSYNGNRCDVIVDFTFENADDPDDIKVIRWAGADTDNGGKGFAKAGTNALKEMLKKTFLITDREDRKEETENLEHQTDEGIQRSQVEQQAEQMKLIQQQWATAHKRSLEDCDSLETFNKIKRENSAQLSEMPSVTREFFDDLYRETEARLKEGADGN